MADIQAMQRQAGELDVGREWKMRELEHIGSSQMDEQIEQMDPNPLQLLLPRMHEEEREMEALREKVSV